MEFGTGGEGMCRFLVSEMIKIIFRQMSLLPVHSSPFPVSAPSGGGPTLYCTRWPLLKLCFRNDDNFIGRGTPFR
jgi:hypothetical protein